MMIDEELEGEGGGERAGRRRGVEAGRGRESEGRDGHREKDSEIRWKKVKCN